ncbi:MAG: hypothetical protein ACLU9S_24585 [Oscillospiraceae bacterium]
MGYGTGPRVAQRLEQNNIIVNYQATPDEEASPPPARAHRHVRNDPLASVRRICSAASLMMSPSSAIGMCPRMWPRPRAEHQ